MKSPEDRTGYLFSKGYSNYVFMLLFLLYMFDYIDRTIVTSMFTSIERDWGITHTQSGLLVSAVYWAIVILTFPVSILIDRWSRTKTIGIMAIMWSLATALCALTGNYVQLFMARLLIGVGEAGYAPGGSAMISGLYPVNRRAMMMGLSAVPRGLAAAAAVGASVGASVVTGAAVVGASVAAGAAVGCAHALKTIEASTRTEIRTNIMLVLFFTSFLL